MIDAGFSGVETMRRLAGIGVDIASLSAILITHEHTDHIRGVSIISRKYQMPVFATKDTFLAANSTLTNLFKPCHFSAGTSFSLKNLTIHPFSISHDAADPVGFVINDGHNSMGYCTDTGTVSRLMRHRLSGCHGLVLECNHDPEMLKNGSYPPHLKQRIRSKTGHLANSTAADFLADIMHDDLTHVVLSHISESNNRPSIAHKTVIRALQKNNNNQPLPKVTLAPQAQAGELVTLNGCASGKNIGQI